MHVESPEEKKWAWASQNNVDSGTTGLEHPNKFTPWAS
jgi:hypothetical protein